MSEKHIRKWPKAKTQGKWSGGVKSKQKIGGGQRAIHPGLKPELATWVQQCQDSVRPIMHWKIKGSTDN